MTVRLYQKKSLIKNEDVIGREDFFVVTCDTPFEIFNNEVSRLSGIDDDSEHEADDDMGFDPSDVAGDDEVELTDEESSDDINEDAEDYKWYEALEDCKLKDESLRNKAIMEGSIKEDDESRYEQKRQWNTYTNYDDAYEINHEHNKSEELCEIQEQPEGERVGKGGRGRRPREGNDERVKDLNGQGNDQVLGANEGVKVVNRNVMGANRGSPDFSTIIAKLFQNLLPAMLAQVSNRGNVGNHNGNVVNENVQENVRNVIVNGNWVACSYMEFLAYNPKEYNGKGGALVLTRWMEKMENVQDMSSCSNDQKVKYIVGSFVGKALTWWNSQIRTLSREVAVSMSWNDFKFMMIQEFCPSHEMQKLESELWNHAI
ncbi:reverse transcriptase domain-containing protein [Tanacetum coccineum]